MVDLGPAADIDYSGLGRLLATSDLSPSPSEAHGILCGLICGGDPEAVETWLDQVLPGGEGQGSDLRAAEARAGLRRLADQTLWEIQGPAMGFTIRLPDELETLAGRAIALYDWVRGFLFALGVLRLGEQGVSHQAREILQDLTRLTHLDLNDLDEGEENEAALTEITEFLRVAAMLLYQERVLDRAVAGQAR